MSGYWYGDTWIGDEYQARCDAAEEAMLRSERQHNDLCRCLRVLQAAVKEDSENGHSRRYWSLMVRLERTIWQHLPESEFLDEVPF